LDNDLSTSTRASCGDAKAFKHPTQDEPNPEKEMSEVCRHGSADEVHFVPSWRSGTLPALHVIYAGISTRDDQT
jgi:hypothetical protein